jgi:hypothetical protein
MKNHSMRSGQMAVMMLLFAGVTVTLIAGLAFLGGTGLQLSVRQLNRVQAFSIAEAGIEYYRWHLAHDMDDFTDGTGGPGPYVHPYYDKDGTMIGNFSLEITPPPAGSTLIRVRSTGRVVSDPSVVRVIEVRMAVPSFARFSLAINDDLRIGSNTDVYGEMFSNGGIHFDGIAHNIIRSARESYDDPDHGGQEEFGVHTHSGTEDPLPPAAVPYRPDIFRAGRQFPVPALDFVGVTQDLSEIRGLAQSGGIYATSSGAFGYELEFSGTNYSLYKVTALTAAPNGCTNTSNEPGWGTWSVQTKTLVSSGAIPANNTFFVEDHLWVKGTINGRRLTIGSGRFPDNAATRTSIIVNEDLRYTNTDGSDSIALVAQNHVLVGLFSNDVLRIDGILFAENGRVARYYYQSPSQSSGALRCGPYATRQKITIYGALISNAMYELGFEDSTGYLQREIIFDSNLLYNPPSSIQTGNEFLQVSWDEIQ